MASGPQQTSQVPVQAAPSNEVTWQTPMRVVLAAALVLCMAVVFMRWYEARSRAESDGQAALALIEQQPPSVTVQAPASLAVALKPRESVLSLVHCIGAQCSTMYAQPMAATCDYAASTVVLNNRVNTPASSTPTP